MVQIRSHLIDLILRQVETFQRNPRSLNTNRYVNWQEIKYLKALWYQLNLEFQDIEKLLPLTLQKRGLLNCGGNILNFLFGTATSAMLQTSHQVVEGVKLQQWAISHSL
jgi:hypothetical protein